TALSRRIDTGGLARLPVSCDAFLHHIVEVAKAAKAPRAHSTLSAPQEGIILSGMVIEDPVRATLWLGLRWLSIGPAGGPVAESNQTSVFSVGGGPVGLAMALLLDRFGIDCVVAERNPTTTEHPKSRGCWPRTMELFRQWGIEDAIRARGLQDNSAVFAFKDSIAGHRDGRTRGGANLAQNPTWKCRVARD